MFFVPLQSTVAVTVSQLSNRSTFKSTWGSDRSIWMPTLRTETLMLSHTNFLNHSSRTWRCHWFMLETTYLEPAVKPVYHTHIGKTRLYCARDSHLVLTMSQGFRWKHLAVPIASCQPGNSQRSVPAALRFGTVALANRGGCSCADSMLFP